MGAKRIIVLIVSILAMLVPAGSSVALDPVADPTGVFASENLKVHTAFPEASAIGARFRGNLMYMTTLTGLSIYDVSRPTAPKEIGQLPLPHFENEDVDLGGNILLISNDGAESRGILYVIDISDPSAPTLRAAHDMGGNPAGPVVDAADFFGAVPHQGAPGHTASCVLDCTFAWVTDGGEIRVIDLRNPAAPASLGNFSTPAGGLAAHDVQMDENGIAWISGYGGVAGYRLPGDYADGVVAAAAAGGASLTAYHASLLVAKTNAQGVSRYGETFGLDDGSTYNDFIHHNSRRLRNSNVVYVTEEDYSRPGCRGAGSFETWRLPLERTDLNGNGVLDPTGEEMVPLDKWETELLADTAQPAAMCSAHYFDVRQNVVAQAWYEQGLRLLDVSDPTNIRQIAYFFTPNALSWASYFPPTDLTGRVVYLLDATMGLVVLEYDRPRTGPLAIGGPQPNCPPGQGKGKGKPKRCTPPEARSAEASEPTVTAPVLAQWTAGVPRGAASREFGFACRLSL